MAMENFLKLGAITVCVAALSLLCLASSFAAQDAGGLAALLGQKGSSGILSKFGQQTTSTGSFVDGENAQPTVMQPQPEERSVIEEGFTRRLITSGLRSASNKEAGGDAVAKDPASMGDGWLMQSGGNPCAQGRNGAGWAGTFHERMSQSGMNQSGMNQSGMNQSGMNQSGMNQSGMNLRGVNASQSYGTDEMWTSESDRLACQLKQFGYQLFSNPASAITPLTDAPIPPEYVLGPGDELRVQYYGSRSDSLSLTVDRNGMVNVPDLGEIGLTGMSYNSARAALAEQISKKLTGVTASITMGHLRSMRVFVLGDVRNPGSYQVGSLATVSYALVASGGPSKRGSLRHIQLKRGGKKVGEIDMYDFLLKGDGRNDRQLLPGDVVFVPPIGEVVAVAGEVTRPGIYELNRERGLREVIGLAGRPLHTADKSRVEIDRMERGGGRQKSSMDMDAITTATAVQPGDLVLFYPMTEEVGSYVDLFGAVKQPGRYGYKLGMTIRDLLPSSDSLLPQSYLQRVEVTHHTVVNGESRETSRDEFDLTKLISGQEGGALQVYDEVLVRTIADWGESQRVALSGEVKFPGVYSIAKGEKLSSLIERAGGLSEEAYLPALVFTRDSIRKQQLEDNKKLADQLRRQLSRMEEDLDQLKDLDLVRAKKLSIDRTSRYLAELETTEPVGRLLIDIPDIPRVEADVVLRDGDVIKIPARPSEVIVMGQVYNSAVLSYEAKHTSADYIEMAGGVTERAKEDSIFLVRASGVVVAGKKAQKAAVKPGDAIVVPQDSERMSVLDGAIAWTKVLMQSGVSLATLRVLGVF